MNAVAAILVARDAGIADNHIGLGLAELPSDPMRFSGELIGDSGIMIYNDAYNANPDAVLAALATFAEVSSDAARRIVILGDMMELGADSAELHAEVGRAVVELGRSVEVSIVLFIGPLSAHGAQVVIDSKADLLVAQLSGLDDVLCEGIAGMIESGDSVLIKGSRSQALERVVDAIRLVVDTSVSPDPQSV
jgi:UDP-N-acetylmuramoyl-tripeptide--D-alanyl-D-alanine ligase